MMQVTKVWWDGEKLMAEPIDPAAVYKEESTCNKTLLAQGKAYPRTCKKCGLGPCIADREQPAQQEPVALEEYDAGLLNDFGGGNVYWWWDYIRAELGRAYEHYQSQMLSPPVQRTWVGLTDEQIEREWQFLHDEEGNPPDQHDFARAIEAAHGIKENT